MKISVDYDACEANAVCEAVAPEVFHVDDEDNLHIVGDPTPETVENVRRAVESCPKLALTLHED